MKLIQEIKKEFEKYSRPEKAKNNAWFFKSGKGEYAEGDNFLGITVPDQRKIAKKFLSTVDLESIKELMYGEYHEHRLTAVFLLVGLFNKNKERRKEISDFYLKHRSQVNNWDIVDSSAHLILGRYILENNLSANQLLDLAKSDSLWDQRIAIIATAWFIRNNKFDTTLEIAKILLNHEHDLIHKAVGWMLREVGNRNLEIEEEFLKKHYKDMPRTMLRYAIEKFPESKRKAYLNGKI